MHRIYVHSTLADKRVKISGEVAHRLLHVLRLRLSDRLTLVDATGYEHEVEIVSCESDAVEAVILQTQPPSREPCVSVTLYAAIPKGEKMDWVIQKAVELGVSAIVPMLTARSVVKLDKCKAEERRQRWQKIAIHAMEQCGRCFVPPVRAVVTFAQALQEARKASYWFLCYEGERVASFRQRIRELRECGGLVLHPHPPLGTQNPKHGPDFALMVGAEGGFEPSEVEAARSLGAAIVSLGTRVLRAETAAITALALLLYELGELG